MEKFDKEAYDLLHVDVTMNYHKLFEMVITKDAWSEGRKSFVGLQYMVTVNDIFRVKNKAEKKYYIKKLHKVDEIDGYIYEFKRLDKDNVVQVDLNRLKKGETIKIKGHLN